MASNLAKTLEKSVFMIERMNASNHFDKMLSIIFLLQLKSYAYLIKKWDLLKYGCPGFTF